MSQRQPGPRLDADCRLRLPAPLLAEIDRLAELDRRSRSDYLRLLIEAGVRREQLAAQEPPGPRKPRRAK